LLLVGGFEAVIALLQLAEMLKTWHHFITHLLLKISSSFALPDCSKHNKEFIKIFASSLYPSLKLIFVFEDAIID